MNKKNFYFQVLPIYGYQGLALNRMTLQSGGTNYDEEMKYVTQIERITKKKIPVVDDHPYTKGAPDPSQRSSHESNAPKSPPSQGRRPSSQNRHRRPRPDNNQNAGKPHPRPHHKPAPK